MRSHGRMGGTLLMAEPINVGDLVMIVKPTPCCARSDTVGVVFQVSFIFSGYEHCRYCGSGREVTAAVYPEINRMVDFHRLKRIPPLGELDDVKQDEEIAA